MGDFTLLFSWIFKIFVTGCVAIIGWFMKSVIQDVAKLKDNTNDCALSHEKLRTHISEKYATKEDVNTSRLEYRDELKRLHERLDTLPRDVMTLLKQHK